MYILTIIILIIAAILQLILGNIPIHLFYFPINAILLIALVLGIVMLPTQPKNRLAVAMTQFGTKKGALTTITILLLNVIVLGLAPQYYSPSSWLFVASMILLLLSLGLTIKKRILSGIKLKTWRDTAFVLAHVGLWIALTAGLFGVADSVSLRLKAFMNVPTNRAVLTQTDKDGIHHPYILPFNITANTFTIDKADGHPIRYSASITTLTQDSTASDLVTRTNAPASYKGYDIYLTDYDASHEDKPEFIVLEITRQPWRYITLTGILMLILGCITYALFKIR